MACHFTLSVVVCFSCVATLSSPLGAQDRGRFSEVTRQVSVDAAGHGGNELSRDAAISADGRFVAFVSGASNLVPDDTNNAADVFVRDLRNGTTERVNLSDQGQSRGTNAAFGPAISGDGRFVAFESDATDLVADDRNGIDVFVRDRREGITERVSAGIAGDCTRPSISADGRFVAFVANVRSPAEPDGVIDIFVHDRVTRTTEPVNVDDHGNQVSSPPPFNFDDAVAISANGRFVTFTSGASTLVAGDVNGAHDVFVHDRLTHVTELVTLASSGRQANASTFGKPAISAGGRFIVFYSQASNLVPNDTNGFPDTFVRDRKKRRTERVSVDSEGNEVPFGSNLADAPAISAGGRFIAFVSIDSHLVADDTNRGFDVFVHDRRKRTTRPVSANRAGEEGNGAFSFGPAMSRDGKVIAFTSDATNFSSTKLEGVALDVFVHGPEQRIRAR
jgi:Tol biopolymer transport system component